MASIVGEQNNLLQLLSFKHFPAAPAFAIAIPEVQGVNVIPMSVQREQYKKILLKEKGERMREKLSVP